MGHMTDNDANALGGIDGETRAEILFQYLVEGQSMGVFLRIRAGGPIARRPAGGPAAGGGGTDVNPKAVESCFLQQNSTAFCYHFVISPISPSSSLARVNRS